MAAIVINQRNGGTSPTTNPQFTVGNAVAVGEYIQGMVAQKDAAMPGVPTDSLGNTYTQCGGALTTPNGTLSVRRFHCLSKAAGKPRITLSTTAACAFGYFTASNVAALTKGMNPLSSSISEGDSGSTTLAADGQTNTLGDIIVAVVFSLGSNTFTLVDNDFTTAASWGVPASASGVDVSAQFVTLSPNPAGYALATWTASVLTDSIAAGIALAHS